MLRGACACNPGYKQARDSAVKCLSVGESLAELTRINVYLVTKKRIQGVTYLAAADHECHSDLDCPKGISCLEPLGVIDQFSLSYELRYPPQGGGHDSIELNSRIIDQALIIV